jgi:DNA-directed RNA polymerase subunit N (RpoN/RPB10)
MDENKRWCPLRKSYHCFYCGKPMKHAWSRQFHDFKRIWLHCIDCGVFVGVFVPKKSVSYKQLIRNNKGVMTMSMTLIVVLIIFIVIMIYSNMGLSI